MHPDNPAGPLFAICSKCDGEGSFPGAEPDQPSDPCTACNATGVVQCGLCEGKGVIFVDGPEGRTTPTVTLQIEYDPVKVRQWLDKVGYEESPIEAGIKAVLNRALDKAAKGALWLS
jgi:hypothetical protein